jgi:hypothetical protein
MASLILCTACQRHIRPQEEQCPFCGAAQKGSSSPFREVVIPRDAKRATLFVLGLSLAGQACGGQTDANNDRSARGAGASVGSGTGGSGNAAGGRGGTAGNGSGANPDPCENPLAPSCPTPPYGLGPPPPGVGGNAKGADAGAADTGPADAGSDDAGPADGGG